MYHIGKDGKPGKCSATSNENCPYGSSRHFNTVEEAQHFIINNLKEEYSILSSSSRQKNNGDNISASISKDYAHLSLELNHMHNSSDIGNDLELLYYSSPQGQKELERRLGYEPSDQDYLYIKEVLNSDDYTPIDYSFNKLEEVIEKGNNQYNYEWSHTNNNEVNYSSDFTNMDQRKELKHSLINYSYSWLKNLSTKEQDSISILTSNGFIFLQIAMKDKGYHDEESNKLYNNYHFDNYIDKEYYYQKNSNNTDLAKKEILKAKREFAHNIMNNTISAFNKAPQLDNPIVTYRGTNFDEIKEIIGKDSDISHEEIMTRITNGNYNDLLISKNSRIRNIPISSTIDPTIARRFSTTSSISTKEITPRVFIEIKRKTMTSPVNVSAWGTAEMEVLTNPLSEYKIHGGYHDKENDRIILQIEEE